MTTKKTSKKEVVVKEKVVKPKKLTAKEWEDKYNTYVEQSVSSIDGLEESLVIAHNNVQNLIKEADYYKTALESSQQFGIEYRDKYLKLKHKSIIQTIIDRIRGKE